ncbi:MAG: hypothetical protein AMS14_04595 [Planctomycetes bacterium DG_20]|nr:MAG: hypothetical protein AMS14_04595 [Planctomycetes bacterium DG_20]
MTTMLCPLASGSLGNALLVASKRTRVLVDIGLSQWRLREALAAVEVEPDDIDAVFVTHTHRDHFSASAAGFCLRHAIPVYASEENLAHLSEVFPAFRRLVREGLARPLDGDAVEFGDVTVEAFDVPHDSPGWCQGFRLSLGPARRRRSVAVATDLGHVPDGVVSWFVDATAVVIESNHDPGMLWSSNRPADLIDRIAGPRGHLSNEEAAEAMAEILGRSRPGRVADVVLAHLSRDCNTPALALEAQAHLARGRREPVRVFAARQFEPGPRVVL